MNSVNRTPESNPSPDLQPPPSLNTVRINDRVIIRDDPEASWRVVLVSGIVFSTYHADDKHSQRLACVALRLGGLATQAELSEGFRHGRATQCRWEAAYTGHGVAGLSPYRPEGRPVSIPKSIEDTVVELHGQAMGMRRIGERLGLSLNIVRGVYQRRGLQPHLPGEQQKLLDTNEAAVREVREIEKMSDDDEPEDDEEAEESEARAIEEPQPQGREAAEPAAASGEPWDGLLVPAYETRQGVSWAGVLLAVPVMRRHRVLEVFSELYGTHGILAVYGLQTVVSLMVVYLGLWRIKRPEHLKGHSPWDLGRVMGLERAPEVRGPGCLWPTVDG